ncbi:hypothetical protein [Sandaracinus amylolyticus]|uniref:hypothetical protein n=1 Tax=Sandaracinus amylolyticus TaxID=927083 RepID=UPI001F403A6B|nr:hypothetical protein [Sandaracinus amylolyticus]UJR79749.1 Hypothetical protein I5071_17870 [Sandaracinus amylolyticus]
MRPAPPISLADHRAQRLVARLLVVQENLEAAAVHPEKADALFDELERVLEELRRNAQHVKSARLRGAIQRACDAHDRWWGAVSTSAERAAVLKYLRSIDALARAAAKVTPRR